MKKLQLLKAEGNPFLQPPLALFEDVIVLAAKLAAASDSGVAARSTVYNDFITLSLTLYLEYLRFEIRESPGIALAPTYICSACGMIGVRHNNCFISISPLPDYNETRVQIQAILRKKAGCKNCPPSFNGVYKLTEKVTCNWQTHCNKGKG